MTRRQIYRTARRRSRPEPVAPDELRRHPPRPGGDVADLLRRIERLVDSP